MTYLVQDDRLAYTDTERGLIPQMPVGGRVHAKRKNSQSIIVVGYTDEYGRIDQVVRALEDPKEKTSWHLLVGRDSVVYQFNDFTKIAYHAGRSRFDTPEKSWVNLNQYSIGIALENFGPVDRFDDRFVKQHYMGPTYLPRDAVDLWDGRWWERYSESQQVTLVEVCRALIEHYGVLPIVGLNEVSSKSAPGPMLDMDRIRLEVDQRP